MPEQADILRAENISKRFGITQALSGVTVSFRRGEVHALMGENGAGKSTLGKALAGLHRLDTGSITVYAGQTPRVLKPGSIDDAYDAGIRIVHQELAQCPNLSAAENICLHAMPTRMGMVDRRAMNDRAARLLTRLDPTIDPEAPLSTLAPGRRQIVQIACSLDEAPGKSKARLIVFDEPTSSLSVAETERLLEIIRRLAAEGLTLVYVSHRMAEIFAVCDRVTVLRDGKFVATTPVKELDEPTLVEQMIGRRLTSPVRAAKDADAAAVRELAGDHPTSLGPVRLRLDTVNSPAKLHSVSLQVRAGEVVGLGGLVGSGRSELLDAIFGLDPAATGALQVDDVLVRPGTRSTIRRMIAAKVGYVPEDRRLQGLFFQLGIDENLIMPRMPLLARLGLRNRPAETALADERFNAFQVKAASPQSLPGSLSGGNQQKVLIARWMAADTGVLLLDEPTRGIDIGTKAEIYKLIRAAADKGAAILLVSSEMPELLALSDRVMVMCGGRISGELTGADATQTNILRLATQDSRVTA